MISHSNNGQPLNDASAAATGPQPGFLRRSGEQRADRRPARLTNRRSCPAPSPARGERGKSANRPKAAPPIHGRETDRASRYRCAHRSSPREGEGRGRERSGLRRPAALPSPAAGAGLQPPVALPPRAAAVPRAGREKKCRRRCRSPVAEQQVSARKEGREGGKKGKERHGAASPQLSSARPAGAAALRSAGPGCRHAPRTRNAITSPPRSRTLLSRAGRRRAAATIRRLARERGCASTPPRPPRGVRPARAARPPRPSRRSGSGRAASRGAERPARGALLSRPLLCQLRAGAAARARQA